MKKAGNIICLIFMQSIREEVVLSIDGELLEGNPKFPKNKLKMLEVWMDIHKEELEANWQLLSRGEKYFRIDPLK